MNFDDIDAVMTGARIKFQDLPTRDHYMTRTLTVLFFTAFLLGACVNAEPFEPDMPGEIPSGSGIFTGEEGEFVIYHK